MNITNKLYDNLAFKLNFKLYESKEKIKHQEDNID